MIVPKLQQGGELDKSSPDYYQQRGQQSFRPRRIRQILKLFSPLLIPVAVVAAVANENDSNERQQIFQTVVSQDGFSGGESVYSIRNIAHFALLSLGECQFPEATAAGDFSSQEPRITTYTVEFGSKTFNKHGEPIPAVYTVQNAAELRHYPELAHC